MKRLRRKRQIKWNKEIVKTSVLKIVVLLIIVGLNWTGLLAVGQTFAYFFDNEDANNNTYRAGILDFYLSSPTSNFIPPEIVISMMPGDSVTREISVIKETDSNFFQYIAQTVKTGGDDDFCNALDLEAELDGVAQYSGKLMSFISATTTFSTSTDDWFFRVTLPSGTSFPLGKVCQINFVFNGWQINLPDSSSGFSDQEEIASSFATGGMKINKVYYDVDAEHGSEIDNEWIEIYNPLDSPVDISGWIIEDNNSTDTIPSSNSIPARGFAIITANTSTWQYWEIPDDVVKIVLTDGTIGGDGLDNDSDRVILKMPDGTEDDAMSYGTDTYAFTPPCPDVAEGHILGRVSAGFDTNQASDWKDLALPQISVNSIGGPNYCGRCNHSGPRYCGLVLFYNQFIKIGWTATNPNGSSSDLSIDIIFITDNDCSGTPSSGDNTYLIADNVANTGSFSWKVQPYFYGYAWIKVIATGPENFMVNDFGTSNPAFEPLLSEIEEFCSMPENSEFCLELENYLESEGISEITGDQNENATCTACNCGGEETINNDSNNEIVLEEETINNTDENTPEETTTQDGEIVTEENQTEGEIPSGEDPIIPAGDNENETAGETTEDVIEDIILETDDSVINEENTEESTTDESAIDETSDEAPATEEQQVTLPDEDSSSQGGTGESDGNTSSGGNSDSGEGGISDSGGVGDTGETISE